jgi:phenylacetate-CoA ligase
VKLIERANNFIVARVTFPASNFLLNRRNVLRRYRELRATENYSEEALRETQFKKLVAVLKNASSSSPFYQRRFREIGFEPEDLKSLDDIRRIPPLSRKDVVENRRDIVDLRFRGSIDVADRAVRVPGVPLPFARFRKHKLVRSTTTGSTGTPMVFYEDGSVTALNWAEELRLKNWFGIPPGAREARMTMDSADFTVKNKVHKAREFLWNQITLPGYYLSDHEYGICLAELQRSRPRVLWGVTTALTQLAQYIQRAKKEISSFHPDLVISRAAPLFAEEKKLLSDVFQCPVTNIYGTREVGHIAMTCPHGSMHLNQEDFLVEIEGQSISAESSAPGQILVTELNASAMPFIRYRIGDLGELGSAACPCGRSLRVLKNLVGRTGDVYKTDDGRLIEPGSWCGIFMFNRQTADVEKFQVVYRRDRSVLIRIVAGPGYSAETEAALRKLLDKNLHTNIRFEFEYVPDIKPLRSGKYAMIVNEMNS